MYVSNRVAQEQYFECEKSNKFLTIVFLHLNDVTVKNP